jgi:dTDP-4-dehydrorhamnose 3,5-epimerase
MSSRFDVATAELAGLMIVQRKPLSDSRGYFERIFSAEEFAALGIGKPVVQINHSYTHFSGTVRGMHFQRAPHGEAKLVSCLRGEVWDVAIDLRRGSPTFLRWHAEVLSAENHRSLLIPEGFAHGFQALTDDCELLYLHTSDYYPESEDGVHPEDERVAIKWPLRITEISPRDAMRLKLDEHFVGLE